MYQRDLKIQKGLKNKVQFQFKNSDQKLVSVTTGTYVFSMFDAINQRQLVQKTLTVLDNGTTATRGLTLLEISESDTLNLDDGQYQFTISSLDSDGSYSPTYSNTYYGISGSLELRSDSFPTLKPSYSVGTFQPHYDQLGQRYIYYSGNIPAHPEFTGHEALHTVSYQMTGYRGEVWLEGTMDNNPGYFGYFSEIKNSRRTYGAGLRGFTGHEYINFYGVWSYIRIKYKPTADPITQQNDNSSIGYRGTLDKALYRS